MKRRRKKGRTGLNLPPWPFKSALLNRVYRLGLRRGQQSADWRVAATRRDNELLVGKLKHAHRENDALEEVCEALEKVNDGLERDLVLAMQMLEAAGYPRRLH